MEDDELKSIFQRASEISKAVPKPLREAAFNRAVDALLSTDAKVQSKVTTKKPGSRPRKHNEEKKERSIDYLLEQLDRTAYPQVNSAPRVLERALHLLRVVHDKFSIDGLGPTDIAKILTEKFRLRSTRQAVQKALDGARDYVDRVTRKGRTVYRIMHTGEQYLDSGEYQTSKRRVPRPSGKGGRAKISKSKHPSKDKAESIAIKKKTSGGRPGPRTALNQLVGEGFFDSPQRIIDIKKHLAQTKAHNYKATDLSPTLARMLRGGILDRNRAEDGQYEYQRK